MMPPYDFVQSCEIPLVSVLLLERTVSMLNVTAASTTVRARTTTGQEIGSGVNAGPKHDHGQMLQI